MLTLKAFGAIDVRDAAGQPLGTLLAQPKRAALLAYLALSRPYALHRRDSLLAMFWPELDQPHGRAALSQALSFLRRELDDGVLTTRGVEEVGVDPTLVRSDVGAFEDAFAGGDWSRALDLYQGDLLEGLYVTGSAPFIDWVDREREKLREAAAVAAWKRAHELLTMAEPTEAERVAQRALHLVPTDESPARGFIEALARAGDRAAAVRFYERFARILAQELGVEPAPETVAVAEAVRGGAESVKAKAVAPAPRPPENGEIELSAADLPPAADPEALGAPPREVSGVRGWMRWLVATAFLAILVFGGYSLVRASWTGGPGTLIREGLAAKYDQVVVADLTASDPNLGLAAAEWLRTKLDESDIVRPVSPTAVSDALRRMNRDPSLPVDAGTAREIAIRDGYPLVVAGEIEGAGKGYLLTARLEAPQSGEVLGRFRASAATGDELAAALERMGGEIRARIGEAVRYVRRDPPLQQVTTSSLEALRLYTEASRTSPLDAVPLLERSIALDTTFAMAYSALGDALNTYITQWDRQAEYARKAYRYRDRLPEYQRLLAQGDYVFQRLVGGQDPGVPAPTECDIDEPMLHLYEAYVARHPEDPRPLQNYGVYQERTGHPERAIATYRRLVAMDPSNNGGFHALYAAQLRLGRFEEARKTEKQWAEHLAGADPWRLHLADLELRARQADYDGADSAVTLYQAAVGDDPDAPPMEGDLDAVRGRMREAFRHYDAGVRRMEETGNPELPVPRVAQRARVRLVALGDTAGAMSDLSAALDRLPADANLSGGWIGVGVLYALAGDTARPRQALEALRRTGRGNWSGTRGVLGAALALARGDPQGSLDLLAESETPCTFSPSLGVDHRQRRILAGRAYEALGLPDSAIAEYEAYFTEPPISYPVPLDAAFRFDTFERLGRLYEARGDSSRAAMYYVRAADLWKEADPELQGRVRDLRARAAALAGATARGKPSR